MPQFRLGGRFGGGVEGMNAGIRGLFQTLAQAPYLRQQAEMQAGLMASRQNVADAQSRKYGAQADTEQFNLDQRRGVDDMLADPSLADYQKNQLRALKLVGGGKMADFSKSGQTEQQIHAIRDIQADPTKATSYGQAFAATSGKMPFDNVGNTGRAINQLTGEGTTLDGTLAKLFDDKTLADTSKSRSQAGAAQSQIEKNRAATEKLMLEAGALRDSDVDAPLSGKPLTNAQRRNNVGINQARQFLAEVPPRMLREVMRKSEFDLTPQDKDLLARLKLARTPKFGERDVPEELNHALGLDQQVIGQVVDQLRGPAMTSTFFGLGPERKMTEEEIASRIGSNLPQAERGSLDDYILAARRRMGGSGGPASTGNPVSSMPPGSRQIGTSGGRPVYQSPDGRRFIVE